jgi:hypothetical protein
MAGLAASVTARDVPNALRSERSAMLLHRRMQYLATGTAARYSIAAMPARTPTRDAAPTHAVDGGESVAPRTTHSAKDRA